MTIVIGPNSGRTLALGERLELCFKADDAETEGRYSVSVVDVAARDAGPGLTAVRIDRVHPSGARWRHERAIDPMLILLHPQSPHIVCEQL